MTRENGYYWIKISYGEWEPGEWWSDIKIWWLTGISAPYNEDEIAEVGEKIIKT